MAMEILVVNPNTTASMTEKIGATAIRVMDFTRVEVPRSGAGAARRVRSATRSGKTTEIVMESGEALRVESESFAIDVLGG